MKDIVLAICSIVSSVFMSFLFVAIGWYIVWKLFLSRFKFVKELLGGGSDTSAKEVAEGRSKIRKPRRD